MKPKTLIIPLFIMNRGCPNRCIYCNESILAGNYDGRITESTFRKTVDSYLQSAGNRFECVQIAFYGGNFTGLAEKDGEELLSFARPYLESGAVNSLRVSTRPDHIEGHEIRRLYHRGVRTVEIGAQSMNDDVLALARRGHDALSVRRALSLLKEEGFEAGVHLMAGLPGETDESFLAGIDEVIGLAPHTVRIHPTLVLRGTELERLYREGHYEPLSLDHAVELCAGALVRLKKAGINVIRLGLHLSETMKEKDNVLAGPLHPSFRSLVEERLFRRMAVELLKTTPFGTAEVCLLASPGDLSRLRGQRKGNVRYLENLFPHVTISMGEDPAVAVDSLRLVSEGVSTERSLRR